MDIYTVPKGHNYTCFCVLKVQRLIIKDALIYILTF